MNEFLVPILILGIAFLICLILIFRGKWIQSRKNLDDYQGGRNKLTFRKESKKELPQSHGSGSGFIGRIMGGFIVIFIGFSLLPIIAGELKSDCGEIQSAAMNVIASGSYVTNQLICGDGLTQGVSIILIIFAIGILLTSVGIISSAIRDSGLL